MAFQYQSTTSVGESAAVAPTERQMQALWFEQWYRPTLCTDDGAEVEIVQAGNWNHGAGPDFHQAAIRRASGELATGRIEIHLRARDWETHGHHLDPAYDDTILHVVWEKPAKTFFPATHSFRCVPQVILSEQLVASWEELKAHLPPDTSGQPLPVAQAGFCQKKLQQQPVDDVLGVVRAAGAFRLGQKAQRLHWRVEAVGLRQALWEALAEGLGYSGNKIPFRLLAQRLPHAKLARLTREKRFALIFGLSGLLPATTLEPFDPQVRRWIRPQWDLWWRIRPQVEHAILPRTAWKLAGVRPWNRPERRLAALAALVPLMGGLEKAIERREVSAFTSLLTEISDPFWDEHTTFTARPLPKPYHLLGAERIADLAINVFWPLVAQSDSTAAGRGWRESESAPNQIAELARQRILGSIDLPKKYLRETLVQQGLLQIYADYCQHDHSACAQCKFPGMVDVG